MMATGPTPAQAASGDPAATSKSKKKARGGYPPARLWYRIKLEFEGDVSGQLSGPSGDSEFLFDSNWQLRSTGAVRVSLMCAHTKGLTDPFFHTKKIKRKKKKGKLTKVGGCRKNASDKLVPTVRFGAKVQGEVRDWNAHWTQMPVGCGSFAEEHMLLQPQMIVGSVGTENSALSGLTQTSEVSNSGPDFEPIDMFVESTECTHADGTPYTSSGSEGTRPFGLSDHIGSESVVDEKPVSDSLQFTVSPRRFGKTIKHSFAPIKQSFDTSRLGGPEAGPWHYAAKNYRFKLTLNPCPNRGRNVKSC